MTDRIAELEARVRALEAELTRLRDIDEIKALKARYCYFADGGWGSALSTDAWMTLFTEDAVVRIRDASGEPVEFADRESLRVWHKALPHHAAMPRDFVAWHGAVNPVIEIEGDTARAIWHTLTPLVSSDPHSSVVLGGVNEEEYVRTDDGWRISRVEHLPGFLTKLGDSSVVTRSG
jgi:hypothetical protein